MTGLYKILSKEGNFYRIELPDLIKVYPIFLLNKLQKTVTDPLPG